jgi:hypothetical protein
VGAGDKRKRVVSMCAYSPPALGVISHDMSTIDRPNMRPPSGYCIVRRITRSATTRPSLRITVVILPGRGPRRGLGRAFLSHVLPVHGPARDTNRGTVLRALQSALRLGMCARMRSWRWLGVCVALLSLRAALPVRAAQPLERDPTKLLGMAVDADDLDLASLATRLGDNAVLDSLADGKDTALRLAAVRATPFLNSQELALAPLAQIAQGRDPDLAPAAARRLVTIAQALELDNGAPRESASTFQDTELQLAGLAASTSTRRDIRLCAGEAAHLLHVLRMGMSGS